MNKLDHFIKENLHCKYYLRYMDDIIILDNDKEKLKKVWYILKHKVLEYHLKINKKSNLFNLYNGFECLGAKYQIINNKLAIKPSKKTLKRIKKRLDYLNNNDRLKLYRSLASYYGYYLRFNKNRRFNFVMPVREKYDEIKKGYHNYIIMVRDKNFYRSYNDDALIIHYIMKYKYNDEENMVAFGINAYDNVIDNLLHYHIGYVLLDEEKKIFVEGYLDNYGYFEKMANKAYEEEKMINHLKDVFEKIMMDNLDKADDLEEYLLEYRKRRI